MQCTKRTTASMARLQRLRRQLPQAEQAARDSFEAELQRIAKKIKPILKYVFLEGVSPGAAQLADDLVKKGEARIRLNYAVGIKIRSRHPKDLINFSYAATASWLIFRKRGDGDESKVVLLPQVWLEVVDHRMSEEILQEWQAAVQQVAAELSQALGEEVPYTFTFSAI